MSHLNDLGDIRPCHIILPRTRVRILEIQQIYHFFILFFNSQIGSISHYLELLCLHVPHRHRKYLFPSWSQDRVSNVFPLQQERYKLLARYTLLSEICDEQGRRLAYINGWVFWVVGMATIPFIGLQMLLSIINIYFYFYQLPI